MHDREGNIKFAVVLNVGFAAFEIAGGLLTNSLAILSDALHDAGDSIVLTSSLILEKKAKKDLNQEGLVNRNKTRIRIWQMMIK